jgi:hypothetical protein
MTMKRILQSVLVSIVLATVGCSLLGGSAPSPKKNENSNPKNNVNAVSERTTPLDVNWTVASGSVQDAIEQISSKENPKPPTKRVLDNVKAALNELGDDLDAKCKHCPDAQLTAAKDAQRWLKDVEGALSQLQDNEINATLKKEIEPKLRTAKSRLNDGSKLNPTTGSTDQGNSGGSLGSGDGNQTSSNEYSLWDWLMLTFAIALGLLVLVVLVMGVQHLRKQSRLNFETQLAKFAGAQISATKEGHKELADRLTTLTATQKEISNGLLDVHTEVRSLARLVRESSSDRNDRRHASPAINYQTQMEDSLKDEPEFPVSAGDYLGKMNRCANIVRPDFQNGILVNDPEGKGELMLIRDSRVADEAQPLFVVPRATHFQTKQDFYTYYEKYYDCVRPTAGDVWILGPAVVEKVTGGWRLREKGMLEIR